MLLFIILLSLFVYQQDESKIITCKITYSNDRGKIVKCPNYSPSYFESSEWPKEWSDSTKVDDKVKIRVSDKEVIPMLSCAARTKLKHDEIRRNKKNEFKLPLQLPIDKDCQ